MGQAKWATTNQRQVFIQRRWWCVYGRIGRESCYELLQENQTINSNKYCSQLDQLKPALDEKHPEWVNRKCIIFHQDNVRPHISLMTRQKLLQLGWEVLIHPPYSPDIIAPSDFHLLRSLQNFLNGKNVNSLEYCKRHLEQFFAQKDKKSWEDGIMKLPEKWQKVVEQKGEYVVQLSSWRKWKMCLLFLFKNRRYFLANPIVPVV